MRHHLPRDKVQQLEQEEWVHLEWSLHLLQPGVRVVQSQHQLQDSHRHHHHLDSDAHHPLHPS